MKSWILKAAPVAVALALSACGAQNTEVAPAGSEDSVVLPPQILPEAEVDVMACLAHVDILRDAIENRRAAGDLAALARASKALRAEVRKTMTEDETAQYHASSVAVFDDVPVADLQRITGACVKKFAPDA